MITKRDIIDYHIENNIFSISAEGRVYRIKSQYRSKYGYQLNPCKATLADKHSSSNEYKRVFMALEGNRITTAAHILIFEIVSGFSIPKGFVIHHVDGCRFNNRFRNLRLVSRKRNDEFAKWLQFFPGRVPEQMENDAFFIKRALETGQSPMDVGDRFGVPYTTCQRLIAGEIFDYV